MIVIKFELDKQPCILLQSSVMSYAVLRVVLECFLCIGRPIVIKIAASHDFLGGLAAFIFTAGSRLAAIFTAWLQLG